MGARTGRFPRVWWDRDTMTALPRPTVHRPRARLRRYAGLVGVLALLGSLLAACGGEAESPAVGAPPTPSPSAPPSFKRYVALGDSFTAAPLVPVTDVANGCFRSTANYPSLVARELGADLDDRSCGGATTAHLARAQFPGVPPQLTALDKGTDLVTLSIGGNDGRAFAHLVRTCPKLRDEDPDGSPCEASMQQGGQDRLMTTLRRTGDRIALALREIKRRAPDARVLVVGYPQLAAADNACDRLPMAEGDYAYLAQVNRTLTEQLERAARATGTTYIDVWRASKGHDICSDSPWINGAVSDQNRAAAYHPFAEEQQAVADLITQELDRP